MINAELMVDILAEFEAGEDLDPHNPFDIETLFAPNGASFVDTVLFAFVEGNAVPETSKLVPPASIGHSSASFALAGLLQGLALGYEYAKREGSTQ